jgi:flagellar hook-associated protein 2
MDTFIGNTIDNVPVAIGNTTGTKGRVASQIKYLNNRITAIDKRISDFEERLAIKEKGLIEQYSQMETVLSQLTSQANWLAGIVTQLSSIGSGA